MMSLLYKHTPQRCLGWAIDMIDETNTEEQMEDLLGKLREQKQIQIDSLGREVVALRQEATTGRKTSGVEQIWQEDSEYYQGVDEFNTSGINYTKGHTVDSSLIASRKSNPNGKCTAFFNLTRQFVDAASARMGDILLPAGDWNFSIKPTPVPDGYQEPIQGVEKGETRIKDWLVECSYHSEVRKTLEDSAQLGTGILKGPVPINRKGKVVPASFTVAPINFFPDPSCGDNVHDGNYVFERALLSQKQLIALKDNLGYLPEQIDKVLAEGPGKINLTDEGATNTRDKEAYEVWYFYGMIEPSKLGAMEVELDGDDTEQIPAVVTLVNDTPIKAFLNPNEDGAFPYDIMPWQRVSDQWWGIGVARQGRTGQDFFNASARALMDNSALSSMPQLIIREKAIRPADRNWNLQAGKIWIATEQADVRSVGDALQVINIPMVQAELLNNMNEARKIMEDATGIYFILQGQQQQGTTDTVGGMMLLNKNASTILRRLARTFDERITEPHIRRYHDWIISYGEESEKGDARVEAIGSTALIERELYAQHSLGMLQMALNPAFGLDPAKAIHEVLLAQNFVPEKWVLSDEQKQKIAEQPKPEDPSIQIAKIRAEIDLQTAQMNGQLEQMKIAKDTDRDLIYAQTQAQKEQLNAQLKIEELTLRRELSIMDYANRTELKLSDIKADLAKTALTLSLQKELSQQKDGGGQVAKPLAEPPQRAKSGHAFTD